MSSGAGQLASDFTPPPHHALVRAASDPPLQGRASRTRSFGRIGGIVGTPVLPERAAALAAGLGAGAQLFDPGLGDPVADLEACFANDRRVRTPAELASHAVRGRLGDVSGAFALACNLPDGSVLLARDAIGERTLFYARLASGGVAFASRPQALVAAGLVPPRLHLPAVASYLSCAYVPGRETLIEGVSELLPGETLRIGAAGTAHGALWELPGEAGEDTDEEALRLSLRSALERAVRRRLPPSGEPVGALLSGGIDSSLVVALARLMHDTPVLSFSVSFGPGFANELPWSSLVADHCKTQHRIVELSASVVLQHLDEAIGLLPEPIGDPLTVPNALLFREASAHTGIVLNGEGGDPCFGGPKNLPMLLSELYGGSGEDPLERESSYLRAHQKCWDDLPHLFSREALAALDLGRLPASLTPAFEDPRWSRFVTKLMALNVRRKGAHHILPKVDALSAPFGVVPASPLFDREVVEIAFAIPPRLKLRGSVEKWLLKQAVRDLLPAAILERPKSGMLVPVEAWFQGPLLPEAKGRLLDGLCRTGLFERPFIEDLLAGRAGGLRPRRGAKIWLLVTLEAWLRASGLS